MIRLEVLEPTDDRALVSLDDAKAFLGVTGSSEDAELTAWLLAVSSLVAGDDGLQRPPWRQKYRERATGQGNLDLYLSRFPVESVDSVTEGDTTTTASSYEVSGSDRRRLYRSSGCWRRDSFDVHAIGGSQQRPGIVVTYRAGWVSPGSISTWAQSTAYSAGALVQPSSASGFMFEATGAGTSGLSEPAWPMAEGETITDSGVTWTARPDLTVPDDVKRGILIEVSALRDSSVLLASGVKSEQFDGARTEFFQGSGDRGLSRMLQAILRPYR